MALFNDLVNKYQGLLSSAGNTLSSFVQKYPSPASFVQKQVAPQIQQFIQKYPAPASVIPQLRPIPRLIQTKVIPQAIQNVRTFPERNREAMRIAVNPQTSEERRLAGQYAMQMIPIGGISKTFFSKAQVNLARNLQPEARNLIGKFGELVESGKGRNQLGKVGDYVHSVGETVFGKGATNMTSRQLKNAFDVLLQQADSVGGRFQLPRVGLSTQNIRGKMPQATKGVGGIKTISEANRELYLSGKMTGQQRLAYEQAGLAPKAIPQVTKQGVQISWGRLEKPQNLPISQAEILQKSSGGGVLSQGLPSKLVSQVRPSKPIITPESKYSFNINKKRLDLTSREKQTLETTVNTIKPELGKIKGKILSNDEVLKAAKTSDILTQVTPREQTLQAEAALLKARQRLVGLDKNIDQLARTGNIQGLKTQLGDLIDSLRVVSSTAADTGRKLQSFVIEAGDESIRQQILKEIGKTNATTEQILKEAVNVDWNNANSITTFYRKFIKPSASTILDEYRYNNMLSNPRTHLRNAFSNLVQTFITRPTTILAQGDIKGTAQYYTGAMRNFPTAVNEFIKSFTGRRALGKPDIEFIPSLKLPRLLTIPTRAMEASDKFFSALIRGGEMARGITPEQAAKTAEYSLFRQGLFPEGQGKLLNMIDSATAWTYKAPKVVRWFVPFIRTPMNFAKQWIEYSPAGLTTLPGAANKGEQLAKTLIGSIATATGAQLALSGKTTWDTPTDPKQKELFYASGRKPYSVKIGDKWVSMMYAGPFAAALALPTAMKYYQDENRTALTDSQIEKATKATMGMAKFLSGQTFLEGINNFVRFFSGDIDYSLPSNLAFTAGQVIPMEGFVRWITTIVDPVYRKGSGFTEALQKNLPFVSKGLMPYTTPEGELSKRERINLVTPYDITTNKPEYQELLDMRQEKLQQNAILNKMKKDMENQLNQELYNKVQAAEITPLSAQRKQFELEKMKMQVERTGQPQDYNDRHYFINEDTGHINSYNIASKEKELTDARYSLVADQLKRAKDYTSWNDITTKYVDFLKEYKDKLEDEANKLKVQNKIEDLQTTLDQYKGYGGFTKPKKPKKITIKKVTFPKVKVARVKIQKVKIPKPKRVKRYKLKTKKVKSSKVKLSSKLT